MDDDESLSNNNNMTFYTHILTYLLTLARLEIETNDMI